MRRDSFRWPVRCSLRSIRDNHRRRVLHHCGLRAGGRSCDRAFRPRRPLQWTWQPPCPPARATRRSLGNLGLSADGGIFGLSNNMALQDGSRLSLCRAAFYIDVDNDSGCPHRLRIRVRLEDEGSRLARPARQQARSQATAIIPTRNWPGNRGVTAGMSPVSENWSADRNRHGSQRGPRFPPVGRPASENSASRRSPSRRRETAKPLRLGNIMGSRPHPQSDVTPARAPRPSSHEGRPPAGCTTSRPAYGPAAYTIRPASKTFFPARRHSPPLRRAQLPSATLAFEARIIAGWAMRRTGL